MFQRTLPDVSGTTRPACSEHPAYLPAGDALNGIELDELHQNGDIDDDVRDILAMPQTCNLRYKILYMGPLTKRPDL